MPTRVYDETIKVLKAAVTNAKLGNDERVEALTRLDREARRLEAIVEGPAIDHVLRDEQSGSHAYGGRSTFGWEPAPRIEQNKVSSIQ